VTDKKNRSTIQTTTWKKVRDRVAKVNPDLCSIIDQLNPSSTKYPLYEARYPFGVNSVAKGQLLLPNEQGRLVQLEASADKKMKQDLGYNLGSNPVTLVLENSIEIYMAMENHTIPAAFVPAGCLISLWHALDKQYNHQPAFIWNVSSGARSIFMLPKISVATKFEKLRNYFHLDIDMPHSLFDHGKLFHALTLSPYFKDQWSSCLLYFSRSWFDHLHDKAWKNFYEYLLKASWKATSYHRSEFIWNLAFSLIQKARNLKPDPYIADTIKHLFAMSVGAYPGFSPAIDNTAAPISTFQEIILEIYGLDKYIPTIMQPAYFLPKDSKKTRPVYYSLDYPTTFSFSPKARKLATKLVNLTKIRYLLNKYLAEVNTGKFRLENTPIGEIPSTINYDFFHNEKIISDDIRNTRFLFEEDPSFKNNIIKNKEFATNSSFLRGCIRISHVE